ncbi:MAG: hypothetical protein P8Y97_17600, partial [Candidatus Lokiarchaeota archaeon]
RRPSTPGRLKSGALSPMSSVLIASGADQLKLVTKSIANTAAEICFSPFQPQVYYNPRQDYE